MLSFNFDIGAQDTIASDAMTLEIRTIRRAVAVIYALTAIACMALAYFDMKGIYRQDVYFSHWLGRGASRYLWEDLVFYGIVLIAPAALLLFSSFGTFAVSVSRIRIALLAFGVTLPFVMAICLPHPWGGRATLYVAGPAASILAALAHKRISYAKIAFWSAVALLVARSFIIYSRLGSEFTPTFGSYVLWGEVEFTCAGWMLLIVFMSAIHLAHGWHMAGE